MARNHSRSSRIISPTLVLLATSGVVALVFNPLGNRTNHHIQPPSTTTTQPARSAKPATNQPVADAKLTQLVRGWASQQSFSSSVVIRELTGQHRSASLSQEKPMVTASTYKIYVAYAVLHAVDQGSLSLSSLTPAGQTVSATMNNMIINSNNTSAETLGFMIGWDKIDALAAAAGAIHTDINNYDSAGNPTRGNKTSTAADLALVLAKLEQGSLLTSPSRSFLLNLMKNQVYRERIPAGVPSGTTVADKPGWLAPADGYNGYVENDAAVVYGPKSTYVLVVTTSGGSVSPLANLSRQVYDYLES